MKFRRGRRPLPLCALQGCDPVGSAGRRAGSHSGQKASGRASEMKRNGAKPHGPRLASGCRSCSMSCLKFYRGRLMVLHPSSWWVPSFKPGKISKILPEVSLAFSFIVTGKIKWHISHLRNAAEQCEGRGWDFGDDSFCGPITVTEIWHP